MSVLSLVIINSTQQGTQDPTLSLYFHFKYFYQLVNVTMYTLQNQGHRSYDGRILKATTIYFIIQQHLIVWHMTPYKPHFKTC